MKVRRGLVPDANILLRAASVPCIVLAEAAVSADLKSVLRFR
jgi:hypothetical protein